MWPFDTAFMRLALVAGVVVGAIAPMVGSFLVQRRLSLLGDGLGHLAFAGVAAGALFGIAPLPVALVVATLGALAVDALTRRGIAGDLVLALLFYIGIAGGVVLISAADRFDASLLAVLFGQILTVTQVEVWWIVAVGALVASVVAVSSRALLAVAVDEASAKVAGIPVAILSSMLAVLASITVVLAMRVVGVLLVAALMVLPVGGARLLARTFRGSQVLGSLIGVFSVVVGLGIARSAPIAPGGMIVLVSAGVFVLALLFGDRSRRVGHGLRDHGPDEHAGHPHMG